MFVIGNDGDDINEYTLSLGFDLTTAEKNEVNGDTSLPPSILQEMIAPADNPLLSTRSTPVVTIATVMSCVSVAFTFVIIMFEI